MNEKEELKQGLRQELEWVKYRQRMLDIIERKLIEMKQLTELVRRESFTGEEVSSDIMSLLDHIKAIDGESRRIEDRKIIE
jgi:hypothetical protein